MVSRSWLSDQSPMTADSFPSRRRVAWRIAVSLGLAALVGWGLSVRHVEIDLASARRAESFRLLGYEYFRREDDTRVSQLLRHAGAFADERGTWRTVAQRSLWRPISPHFTHHSSLDEIQKIALVASLTGASDEETTQTSLKVLKLLGRDQIGPAADVIDRWWDDRRPVAE